MTLMESLKTGVKSKLVVLTLFILSELEKYLTMLLIYFIKNKGVSNKTGLSNCKNKTVLYDCLYTVTGLTLSMFQHCECYKTVNVTTLRMFQHCECFNTVNVSTL